MKTGSLRKFLKNCGQLDAVKLLPRLESKGLGRGELEGASEVEDGAEAAEVGVEVVDGPFDVVDPLVGVGWGVATLVVCDRANFLVDIDTAVSVELADPKRPPPCRAAMLACRSPRACR